MASADQHWAVHMCCLIEFYGTPLLPHYIELYFVRSVLRIFMCRLYYLMSNDVLVRCILFMGMTEYKAVMSDSRFVRYFLHILMRNCRFIRSLHYTILCKYHYIMFNCMIVRCVHHSVIPNVMMLSSFTIVSC